LNIVYLTFSQISPGGQQIHYIKLLIKPLRLSQENNLPIQLHMEPTGSPLVSLQYHSIIDRDLDSTVIILNLNVEKLNSKTEAATHIFCFIVQSLIRVLLFIN
jgi:hypothetical protein